MTTRALRQRDVRLKKVDAPVARDAEREEPGIDEGARATPVVSRPLDPATAFAKLQARMTLMERRVQWLTDELQTALARQAPDGSAEKQDFAAIRLDPDSLSPFATGFYQREYAEDGTPFRWTGAGPLCEMRLHFDRSRDRRFVIDVGETDLEILSLLDGYVDYAPITLAISRGPRGHVVAGVVPMRAATRLAVVTLALGVAEGDEQQWLGFRFYAMDVEAADGAQG